MIAVDGPGLDAFIDAARDAVAQAPATPMLTPGIAENYANGVNTLSGEADVIARGEAGDGQTACRAALFTHRRDELLVVGEPAGGGLRRVKPDRAMRRRR